MIYQVVEITEEGRYLNAERGFLKISSKNEEIARIPLDDITALIITARGTSFSKEIFTRINERGGIILLCGKNYSPISYVLPHYSHYEATGRLLDQIKSSLPLKKQIWKEIVKAKIRHQAEVLSFYKKDKSHRLKRIAERVSSGDKENSEAYAARLYWQSLFNGEFRRNIEEPGINSLLNYGYSILRALTARAVCAVGLNPALGVHHENRQNNLCLVDDLMEPYRPLFDIAAKELADKKLFDLNPEMKSKIVRLSHIDIATEKGKSPLIKAVEYFAFSLVESFRKKTNRVQIPPMPEKSDLQQMVEECF